MGYLLCILRLPTLKTRVKILFWALKSRGTRVARPGTHASSAAKEVLISQNVSIHLF